MKREESVGFIIKTIHNLMMRNSFFLTETGQVKDIPVMHRWIIAYLYENRDKVICQKDIEGEFFIARSTVTSIVKQMEKNGYIFRESVDNDCRLKRICLMKAGEEYHEKAMETMRRTEKLMCEGLDAEEQEAFIRVGTKIRNNLEKMSGLSCEDCMKLIGQSFNQEIENCDNKERE